MRSPPCGASSPPSHWPTFASVQVIGKMQTGHISLVTSMLGDFKHCAPAKVLAPLQGVLDAATRRGRAFFNVRASECRSSSSVAHLVAHAHA